MLLLFFAEIEKHATFLSLIAFKSNYSMSSGSFKLKYGNNPHLPFKSFLFPSTNKGIASRLGQESNWFNYVLETSRFPVSWLSTTKIITSEERQYFSHCSLNRAYIIKLVDLPIHPNPIVSATPFPSWCSDDWNLSLVLCPPQIDRSLLCWRGWFFLHFGDPPGLFLIPLWKT